MSRMARESSTMSAFTGSLNVVPRRRFRTTEGKTERRWDRQAHDVSSASALTVHVLRSS